jgi:hypothetical protein
MPEQEAATIVVVAKSRTEWDGIDSAAQAYDSNISYASADTDLFAQSGGGENPQEFQMLIVNLEVHFRLPGYSFPVVVGPDAWVRMTPEQRANLIHTMRNFDRSPELVRAFDRLQAQNIERVEIYRDDKAHDVDGTRHVFREGQSGEINWVSDGQGNPAPGSTVVITIRESVTNEATFTRALLHEFAHLVFGVDAAAEQIIQSKWEEEMFDDIFTNAGDASNQLSTYADAMTYVGSRHGDTAVGSGSQDTMSGLSGNDNLNGAGGDDLVMGGAGMDTLTGGLGSNAVLGGLDADTYLPTVGVTHEQVEDIGGVDRLDLSSISINDIIVLRGGDDLYIHAPGIASEGIAVTGQWLDAGRIEQFTFAEGTFAATYIESFTTPSGVCYDDMGNPMFCSPYGMPVVLDLDGDGIELIALGDSHVRFDVDGDRAPDRVGWVSGDDGILALDRNGNGRIDDFSEISFRADFRGAGSDLEGLYAYDSDRDGFLTAADDRFDDFLIWRDLNGNGHSEKKELFSLDQLDIVAIDLERRDVKPLDRDADSNQIVATSSFRTADGALHLVGDVALFADMIVGGRPAFSPAGEFAMLQPEPAFG